MTNWKMMMVEFTKLNETHVVLEPYFVLRLFDDKLEDDCVGLHSIVHCCVFSCFLNF